MPRRATEPSTPPPQATSASARAVPRSLLLLACVFVAIASFVPFWPALHAGFSDFDDPGFLLNITQWRGLGPSNLAWIFTTSHMGHYQPLTYLSYALEHTLFGMNPVVFHATNMLLHAGNAVLVLLLVLRLLALRPPEGGWLPTPLLLASTLAALAWGLHPLRVETVAWITERRDVLSMAFLLLATHAYLRAVRPGETALASPRWFVAMHAFLLLSLLAKAWGMTFFVVLLLIDWWALRRLAPDPLRWLADATSRRVLQHKALCVLLALAFMLIAARAQQTASVDTVRSLESWGLPERAMQACYGLVFYLWKTLIPTHLAALYELPRSLDFAQARWWICAAIVAIGVVACMLLRTRRPGLVAAVLAYCAIVSPVLGLMQSGIQLVADRYSYVAIVPIMVLLAWGLARALTPRPALPQARATTLALCGVILAGCAVQTWRQTTLWQNTKALWEHALATGQEGPILRNYYAQQLDKAGQPAEAIAQYERSLAGDPTLVDSWFGLGLAQRTLKRYADAERSFKTAIDHAAQQRLDTTRLHVALGLLYIMNLNRPQEAVTSFEAGVASLEAHANPSQTGVPYLNLASAYGMLGDDAMARHWLLKAAQFDDAKAQAQELLRDLP